MVLPVVNRNVSLLGAHSNEEGRIRMKVAEVERSEGVRGIETVL